MKFGALALFLGLAVAAAAAAACGGSSEDGVTTIEVKAQDLRFKPEVISLPAGKTVKLVLRNLDISEHDLEVVGLRPAMVSGGGHNGHGQLRLGPPVVAVHAEGKSTASITLRVDEPGTYEFYCTVPGHRQAGMVGRVVVS